MQFFFDFLSLSLSICILAPILPFGLVLQQCTMIFAAMNCSWYPFQDLPSGSLEGLQLGPGAWRVEKRRCRDLDLDSVESQMILRDSQSLHPNPTRLRRWAFPLHKLLAVKRQTANGLMCCAIQFSKYSQGSDSVCLSEPPRSSSLPKWFVPWRVGNSWTRTRCYFWEWHKTRFSFAKFTKV